MRVEAAVRQVDAVCGGVSQLPVFFGDLLFERHDLLFGLFDVAFRFAELFFGFPFLFVLRLAGRPFGLLFGCNDGSFLFDFAHRLDLPVA